MTNLERFESYWREYLASNPAYVENAIKKHSAWEAWQAAEAATARRCAELLCIHCINGIPYDTDAKYHPANHRGGVFPCGASRIRAEYPEAWK